MQTVLEQGSIDKPLTFDVGLIQLSFIPVCSLNTCNISVKLRRGFALQCFFHFNCKSAQLLTDAIVINYHIAFITYTHTYAYIIIPRWGGGGDAA